MARQGEGGCRVPPAVQEFSGSRSPGRASLEPQDRWCALLLPIRRSLRKGDGGGGVCCDRDPAHRVGHGKLRYPDRSGAPGLGVRAAARNALEPSPLETPPQAGGGAGRRVPGETQTGCQWEGAPRRLRSRTGETDSRCEGLGTVVTPGEERGRV